MLERTAPAKINLALHVTGRRADGYHTLESLAVFTRHGDRLSVEAAERDAFSVTGTHARDVPLDEGNLVLRARDLLRRRSGAQGSVALHLEKNLPVASGIGGGSSDAAAALHLLSRHWALDATPGELAEAAVQLGADVPMCLAARPLIARGIGEALEPVGLPALPLLLVNPGRPLATPRVFAALARPENPPLPPFPSAAGVEDVVLWLEATRNDLQEPALSLLPEIGAVLDALAREDALLARMSGSGATCFGIFAGERQALAAKKAIASRHPEWFALATITTSGMETAPYG